MSETTDNIATERPEPRASVQDELAEVTALCAGIGWWKDSSIDQAENGSRHADGS